MELKKKKGLIIIPARSGSKRIKNKNLKIINDKPLIYHTIKYAMANYKKVDEIFVSTDSKKILNYSNKIKKNICPILRPKKLAEDNSSDLGYINHAINYFTEVKDKCFDFIIILRPTTPIRQKNLLKRCLEKFLISNCSSIRTAKYIDHTHPYWMYKFSKKKLTEIIKGKNFFKFYQSQKLPKLWMHDGHCDIFSSKNLKAKNNKRDLEKIYGKKMQYLLNKNIFSINIDNPIDFDIAKFFFTKLKK